MPSPGLAFRREAWMSDRCTTERNQAGTDPFGGEGDPDWQTQLSDQPCRSWVQSGREAVSETRTVVVADWSVSFPLDTDVVVGDRIVSLVDGNGETISDDTLYVDYVSRERTALVASVERRN